MGSRKYSQVFITVQLLPKQRSRLLSRIVDTPMKLTLIVLIKMWLQAPLSSLRAESRNWLFWIRTIFTKMRNQLGLCKTKEISQVILEKIILLKTKDFTILMKETKWIRECKSKTWELFRSKISLKNRRASNKIVGSINTMRKRIIT